MIEKLPKIVSQLLTEKDNETHDLLRWIGLTGTVLYFGATAYSVFFLGIPLNYTDFATGFSAILGALGIGIGLKSKYENNPNTQNQ